MTYRDSNRGGSIKRTAGTKIEVDSAGGAELNATERVVEVDQCCGPHKDRRSCDMINILSSLLPHSLNPLKTLTFSCHLPLYLPLYIPVISGKETESVSTRVPSPEMLELITVLARVTTGVSPPAHAPNSLLYIKSSYCPALSALFSICYT